MLAEQVLLPGELWTLPRSPAPEWLCVSQVIHPCDALDIALPDLPFSAFSLHHILREPLIKTTKN